MMPAKKKILFVCIENSCRSQIAEGFARQMGEDLLEVYSAGSKPSGIINVTVIEIMQESGIDISKQKSKGFDDLPEKNFDYVVSMGCKDACPFVPARKHIEWKIGDPKDKDISSFRKARDEIKQRIQDLLKELS